MELQKVILKVKDSVATITMDYMKNLNAIDEQMASELIFALNACEQDDSVHIVILKGGDKAFSAGGDIGFFYDRMRAGGKINMEVLTSQVGKLSHIIKKMPKLVIGAVAGAAAGAGANLALSCDFVICADNAKFIQAFAGVGLVPDTGGSYLLCRSIGIQRTLELCVTGRPLAAEEAKNLGLVYQVVPKEELMETVENLAKKLSSGPLLSYRNIKKQIYAASFRDYERYLIDTESPTQLECFASQDFREGVNAFIEKRKPDFTGR